jgi:hemoglobin
MSNSPQSVAPDGLASLPSTGLEPARSSNIYELLGGAGTVRQLAERFYQLMDELPEAVQLRRLHPQQLDGCADRLFEFLCGWLGGPALCSAAARPLQPCRIGAIECHEWLLCMRLALAELVADAELRAALLQALSRMTEELISQSLLPSTQAR